MISLARSTTSSRSPVHAPVERYFQPPSADTTTIDAPDPRAGSRALDRTRQRRPGRDPGEHPHLGQAPGPLDRLPGPHHGLAVEQLGPPEVLEDRGDVAVVEVAQAVHHLPRRRLDGPDLHLVTGLLAQEPPHPEQRPRRAEPGDEVRDARAVAQDLGAGALVVRLGVRGVAVLVQEEPFGVLLGQRTGHAHGAVGALGAGRLDDLGAPHLEQLAALDRDVGRQHDLERVALHPAHHGQADAGVARRRLDEHLVRLARHQHPVPLGLLDQRQRHPVLDRPAGVLALELDEDAAAGFGLSEEMSTSGVLPMRSRTEGYSVIGTGLRPALSPRPRRAGSRRGAVGDLRVEPLEVADVVVVDVDVHELVQRAVVGEHLARQAGVLGDQVGEDLADGRAVDADRGGAPGWVRRTVGRRTSTATVPPRWCSRVLSGHKRAVG